MTPASLQQTGTAWRQDLETVSDGFTTSFAFQYSNIGGDDDSNGNLGSDGIGFLLQPVSNTLPDVPGPF